MMKKIKRSVWVLAAAVIACVWFSRNGFSEDQSAGFYAGPLSAVAKTVIEKTKSAIEEKNAQATIKTQGSEIKSSGEFYQSGSGQPTELNEENPLSSPS